MKSFLQFISENESSQENPLKSHIDALDDLRKFGLISDLEYGKELRAVSRELGGNYLDLASGDIRAALESPEAKRLFDAGLALVSSNTQILNGNLIFGKRDYHRSDDFALGFFPNLRKVRRMTPKGGRPGPFGTYIHTPQDQSIKEFSKNISILHFYRLAMRWVADHVDLTSPEFKLLRKTAKGYFDTPLD